MIEFRGWSERAHVAKGAEATGQALDLLHAEMMRRYEQMPDDDVEWDDSMGRWIVLVIDEIAELKKAGTPKEIAARQRRLIRSSPWAERRHRPCASHPAAISRRHGYRRP